MARSSVCANCRFNIQFTCRRNAPTPRYGNYKDTRVVPWPEVSNGWWCGEWEAAESVLDAWRVQKSKDDATMEVIIKDLEDTVFDESDWEPFEKPSSYMR